MSGFYSPYWASDARCEIIGITGDVNKGHLARAVLEAIAYQTRQVLEGMQSDANMEIKTLKVDGAMVQNDLLMQFQTDILGLPLVRSKAAEMSALGAAYAAGVAIGFWPRTNPAPSANDLRGIQRTDKTWYPRISAETREKLYQDWLKAQASAANRLE